MLVIAIIHFDLSKQWLTSACMMLACKKLFAYHKLIKIKKSTAGTRSSPW